MPHRNSHYRDYLVETGERSPDFFNDVCGPIMQPGSSSEFAAPCRIGNIARALVPGEVKRVVFSHGHDGNNAAFLVNFMSDRGYLGGILGIAPDDIRLFDAHALARERGVSYDFDFLSNNLITTSSALVEVWDEEGNRGSLVADSTGGGMVCTYRINGFDIKWIGDSHAALIETNLAHPRFDATLFEALFDALLAEQGEAILTISKHQNTEGLLAYFIESSQPLRDSVLWRRLAVRRDVCADPNAEPDACAHAVLRVSFLPAMLPVPRNCHRQSQLFRTVGEWREVARQHTISFAEAAFAYEEAASGWSRERIRDYLEEIAVILDGQIHSLERLGSKNIADTPVLPIYGRHWERYAQAERPLSDSLTQHILTHAFSVNAKIPGFRIVPGPMGTGGGYLFSALDALREKLGSTHERLIESLAVAAALGALAYTHTHPTSQAGCCGESGICCAMTSGAITWLAGGSGLEVERAASMAVQANLGIPCDPIPGGLEFPCLTRTLRAATTAPLYADLALAGIDPLIPYHEMLFEMERHYQTTNHLELCSIKAGCCNTTTALRLMTALEEGSLSSLHYIHES
jgi:L-serine dehydratase